MTDEIVVSKAPGFRFVVEDEFGRRSLEYVISTFKKSGDVYLSPGPGGNSKVSIHESGAVNWSLIHELLPEAPYVPNTGRHVAKWQLRSEGTRVAMFVLVDPADLRSFEVSPSTRALRLAAPAAGQVTYVEIIVTGPIAQPNVVFNPPALWSVKLPNQRVLALRHANIQVTPAHADELRRIRHVAWEKQQAEGKSSAHGLCRVTNAAGVSGLFEFTPARSPAPVPDENFRAWVPGQPGRPRK